MGGLDFGGRETSKIKVKSQKSKVESEEAEERTITFIDTPGHEAFKAMRSRGASAADIAILVVAADDSVKPQTIESIAQIQAAQIPMIVAINKIDVPGVIVDKVKADLTRVGVQLEGFGGDVPFVPVSAKKGTGIKELLDMIILVWDMKNVPDQSQVPLEAVVVETRLDKGRGMVASAIVKKGELRQGMAVYAGPIQVAKVRAMFDEFGKVVAAATPGTPVEILGFTQLPPVGSILRAGPSAQPPLKASTKAGIGTEVPDFLKPIDEQAKQTFKIFLKADTAGSLEAIVQALHTRVALVGSGVGDITEADVLQAKASGAILVGFNVNISPAATKLAQIEKVVHRIYTIIYELLEEMEEVVSGLKEVLSGERELGMGQIIAEFPYEGQRVAGTKVTSGRIARGDTVKFMRSEVEIGRARIKSMRRGKEDVTKIEAGGECGILFDKKVDFALQDAIIPITTG